MFDWSADELNAEQSEAVRDSGSVYLLACPGSGKTRALTYKIALELSALDASRKFVVAITYTNRAADEIKERVQDLGVDTKQLWIGTIHAFCLEWILRPYAIYDEDLAHGFGILDLHAREKLLEGLCKQRAPRITFWDCDYFVTPTGFTLACPDQRKHADVERVLQQYLQELRAKRQLDFELILWHAHSLITSHGAISSILSRVFSLILVDEFQDTKEIQYAILSAILRAGQGTARLFIVGDPNQSIYGSLGGYAITASELSDRTGLPLTERELSANYRSSRRIIEFFGNFNVYGTTVLAEGEHKDYPSIIAYDRVIAHPDLVDRIVAVIRLNIETLGVPPNEICVLAPQWVHLASMTRALVVALPEYQFDGPGMVPFARDIENFWYKLARIALTEPSPAMYMKRLRWAGEMLHDLQMHGVDTRNLSAKDILREANAVRLTDVDGLAYLRNFFEQLFAAVFLPVFEFAHLRDQHDAFFAGSEARIQRLHNEGVTGIDRLEFFKKTFQNRTGITVSTIHGVKGAEFDVVIAYGLLQGMVPHFNDIGGDESAKKLLYVLSSRARKNLYLFSERERARGRWGVYDATEVLAACQFNYDEL